MLPLFVSTATSRRCSSDVDATRTMLQAFITSRLDWCNSLYYDATDELMRCLHTVQNAAARLITGTRRCDHISPVLRQLHRLPVRQRVSYIVTLVHRCLSDHVPSYVRVGHGLDSSMDCFGLDWVRSLVRFICFFRRRKRLHLVFSVVKMYFWFSSQLLIGL